MKLLLHSICVLASLVALLVHPAGVSSQATAQEHIVSPQVMQQQMQLSSAARQKNIATVTEFLSSDMADHAIRSAHMDPMQVRSAIPTLSDQELANLAARSADAQQKFAAGGISSTMLLLIIVVVAIIIIVAAIH